MKQYGFRGTVLCVFLFISAIASPVYAKGACGSAKGSPVWSVNRINLNLYVTDIPLWYTPQIGPRVEIRPSYNSQTAEGQSSPFGSKWQFNYQSFLTEDAGSGQATVAMPDGREDVFTPDGQGGYTKLPGVFNTLTKIGANHFELRFRDDMLYVYIIPANTTLTNPVMTEIRDAYGQTLTFGYNTSNQLSTITDAQNRVTNLQYTGGHVTTITDPFQRTALFGYSGDELTSITDMGGYVSAVSYTTNARDNRVYLSSISNKGIGGLSTPKTWTFNVEPDDGIDNNSNPYPAPGGEMGNLYRITITDPLGNKEEYYYYGPYSWYVSPNDYVEYVDANTNNFKTAKKTLYYLDRTDPKGRISKIEGPEGGYTQYSDFDSSTNQPKTVSHYHGTDESNNPILHSILYTYNPSGMATSITDAKQKITTFEYYPNNIDVQYIRRQGITEPIEFTYNGSTHDVKSIKDRLGNITEFTYNSYGQLSKIEEAKGASIQFTTEMLYNPATFQLSDIKKGGSVIASFTYDTVGRVWTQTGSTGIAVTYDYNTLDKVTRVTFPDTKYIQIDRSTQHPHLIDSITDRSGLTTTYIHNALNQLTEVKGPEENGTNTYIYDYRYDKNGNLWKIIDMMKSPPAETVFEYNKDDRMTKKTYADTRFVTYTYDKMGWTKTFTNARNITKTYTFDENHNLKNITYNDNPPTPGVTLEYDDYNRMTSRTDGTGQTIFTYLANDRLESVDGPLAGDKITYHYNALGNLIDMTPEQGQAVAYQYDYDSGITDIDLGRLKSITTGTNTFTYDYTGVSPLIQKITRPNGSYTEYEYNDPLKRLTALINKASTGSLINSFAYTYEKDLIKTETVTNGTIIDNFLEKTTTYQPNAVNQLVSSTTAPNPANVYAYDDDGNMTTGYTPEGYALAMTYDAENRMKTASYNDGASHLFQYTYAGNSLLSEVIKDGSTTKYLRAGFLPIQERAGNNAITREYTWGKNLGGGIGGLLNLKQGEQNYSYLYDGKGNVSALIDSTQAVVASYAYDPFGKLMKKSGDLDQPYTFSTKEAQPGTGQYYYGYRFYDSCSGKWTTRDPIGERGGINLYGFVKNSPVNFIDRNGNLSMPIEIIGHVVLEIFGHSEPLDEGEEEDYEKYKCRLQEWTTWNDKVDDSIKDTQELTDQIDVIIDDLKERKKLTEEWEKCVAQYGPENCKL